MIVRGLQNFQLTFVDSGLEFITTSYIKAFANNQVDGAQLLGFRPYELQELGIVCVGHQEIILEAVEQLRNFVSSVLFLSSAGNNKKNCFSFSTTISIRRIYSFSRCKSPH
jgi:hypothetical protein